MRNVKDRDEYLRQERLFFLALVLPSVCLLTVCMAVEDLATKINIVRSMIPRVDELDGVLMFLIF